MKKLLTLFFFSFLIINAQEIECPDGYIADCNGNCAPATWGPDDGYCDDGSAWFNLELTLENGGSPVWCEDCEEEGYVAIYFNYEEFNWDGSDCETEEEEEEEIVEEEEVCEELQLLVMEVHGKMK